jgi:hypothetical protein
MTTIRIGDGSPALTPALTTAERAQCLSIAALLQAASGLAFFAWSMFAFITLAVIFTGFKAIAIGTVTILILLVIERYLAFRIRFDAELFEAWGRDSSLDWTHLDQGLASIGIGAKKSKGGFVRSTTERIRGARRLVFQYLLLCVVSVIALLGLLAFIILRLS